jgi:hypothetical protein
MKFLGGSYICSFLVFFTPLSLPDDLALYQLDCMFIGKAGDVEGHSAQP